MKKALKINPNSGAICDWTCPLLQEARPHVQLEATDLVAHVRE